jgi:1,4-dihydroxy-2-naphthoate octaprenyltransferase
MLTLAKGRLSSEFIVFSSNASEGTMMGGLKVWLMAVRLRTLPAAVSPVLVGSAAAAYHRSFRLLPAIACLCGALLIQIGVNLANDYFDHIKGVDTGERIGPVRVTQAGLIAPESVRIGMAVTFLLAVAIGIYLTMVAGWPVLAIGCTAILASLLYSGGPYPLASHGLGDLFSFLFFGPVAVCGTYYVQALYLSLLPVLLSISVGFLVAAILVVNNLRDIPTDGKVGKRTLAVTLGPRKSRVEFLCLVGAAYGLILLQWLFGMLSSWGLLPFLSAPMAALLSRSLWILTGASLNSSLAGTARLTLIFSILLSLGLLLGG